MAGSPVSVEKGIGLPVRVREKYPFATMEVGDSFLYQGKRVSAYAVVVGANQRYAGQGKRFTARQLEDGTIRIWRVEVPHAG